VALTIPPVRGDDAIVVMENTTRHIEARMPRMSDKLMGDGRNNCRARPEGGAHARHAGFDVRVCFP